MAQDGDEQAVPDAMAGLVKAYEALNYSAGAVGQEELARLARQGVAPPGGWLVLDPKEPRTRLIDTPKGKVGLVFFPEVKGLGDTPLETAPGKEGFSLIPRARKEASSTLEAEAKALAKAIKELREGGAAMVVGISPWGSQAEADYLEGHRPDLDILLGAGSGVGFMAKPENNGRTLWMRTYTKGKAVYQIDVLAWPSGKGFKWEEKKNYQSKALLLDDAVKPDPDMERLIHGLADPGDKTK